MPKITKIVHKTTQGRVWVYVDGNYCCSIRERTFTAMGLEVGRVITCSEIQDLEKFHWKNAYGPEAWGKEGVRLDRIKGLIEAFDPRLSVRVVGFGAGTTKFIPAHPEEAGKPDLEVRVKDEDRVLALVEVTGTEYFRGGAPRTYWVRPDKLDYARNHPEQDVWIVLHYAQPTELIIAIKPSRDTAYVVRNKEIRGAMERYVEFSDKDPECVGVDVLARHLIGKI